jgi:hypothetical protein
MRVEVYYNLHKRCLSIRHRGKVIEHAKSVILRNANFRVQPAGRERVLNKSAKMFTLMWRAIWWKAFGSLNSPQTRIWKHKQAVTYNPYKHKTFVDIRTGEASDRSETRINPRQRSNNR